jgi:hypothetical protein
VALVQRTAIPRRDQLAPESLEHTLDVHTTMVPPNPDQQPAALTAGEIPWPLWRAENRHSATTASGK